MTVQLSIPEEEVQQFQPFLRIYTKGKTIVEEGKNDDNRIFLLRQGTVEVSKKIGGRPQVLTQVEAVNFFGEMAALTQRPRTATVTALSDTVVVYAFDNPNMPVFLSNPKWGILLMRRLAESLERMNLQYEEARLQVEQMQLQLEQERQQAQRQHEDDLQEKQELQLREIHFQTGLGEILGTLNLLHQAARDDASLRTMLFNALPELLKTYEYDMQVTPTLPDIYRLSQHWRRHLLAEELYLAATSLRTRKP